MNHELAKVVQSALAFTGDAADSRERLEQLSETDWEMALDWLDRNGLSLYFWHKVRQLKLQDAFHPLVREQFEKRQSLNSIRTKAMIQEWRKLQDLYRSANLNCVVLKGLAKVPEYCPDPALRVQFDHDWLIEKNSLADMHDLLCTAGFEKKPIREQDRIVYLPSRPARRKLWNPLDSYSECIQRPLELHLSLWDCHHETVSFRLSDDFLPRSVGRQWRGEKFLSLCDEDVLVFEVLHAFRHVIHSWCRMSVFYEIAHFLNQRSSDQDFWLRFCTRISCDLRLRQATGVVLMLAGDLFRLPEVARVIPTEFFGLTPAIWLWLERYGVQSAIENFATDKFNLFLLREFVDGQSRWRALSRRRLFPLQISHRLQGGKDEQSGRTATGRIRRFMFFVRRLRFHMRGTLSYAWEFPRWKYLDWRERRKHLSLPVAPPPTQVRRSGIAAARIDRGPSVRVVGD